MRPCLDLAEEGARLVLTARRQERLDERRRWIRNSEFMESRLVLSAPEA